MHMEPIVRMDRLTDDVVRMVLKSGRLAESAKPGQFVNLRCGDSLAAYLRRPISICDVHAGDGTVDIVFQIRGVGTEILSRLKPGDMADLMGPLGTPFTPVRPGGSAIAVGGGIGSFPLLYLLRSMPEVRRTALLGFRNADAVVLEESFASVSESLGLATDDGSRGHSGFVTDLLAKRLETERPDCVYVCGPMPMMRIVVGLCAAKDIPVQVSMEQRMGCGVGACLVCACRKKDGDDFTYTHVCKEGPVFNGRDIMFE